MVAFMLRSLSFGPGTFRASLACRREPGTGVAANGSIRVPPGVAPRHFGDPMSIERLLARQIPYQRVEAQPGVYRIFIRELVLSCSIGVYDCEKVARRRVRINDDVSAR